MRILVTGGCGFIGTNVVKRFAKEHEVTVVDSLERVGSEKNLVALQQDYRFEFYENDVAYPEIIYPKVDVIIHLAAQVGVQESIRHPWHDFQSNIEGTLRILEEARSQKKPPLVVYASTNKVYGNLQVNEPVSEVTPLNFHTPYGCSKGAADQYVLDYHRIYNVPTVVFRQSCIYGPHQYGQEEQGWLAWFLIANQTRQPLTIFGDGNQRRDVLYVDDLVDLYDLAIKNQDRVAGQAFNVGGGVENTLSLNELVEQAKIDVPITYTDWRPADQRYYVSDIAKVKKALGWQPKIDVPQGLAQLGAWVKEQYGKD